MSLYPPKNKKLAGFAKSLTTTAQSISETFVELARCVMVGTRHEDTIGRATTWFAQKENISDNTAANLLYVGNKVASVNDEAILDTAGLTEEISKVPTLHVELEELACLASSLLGDKLPYGITDEEMVRAQTTLDCPITMTAINTELPPVPEVQNDSAEEAKPTLKQPDNTSVTNSGEQPEHGTETVEDSTTAEGTEVNEEVSKEADSAAPAEEEEGKPADGLPTEAEEADSAPKD